MTALSGITANFEAAHRGPFHEKVHGHSWTVEVMWPSPVVGDLVERHKQLKIVLQRLDHQFLDDVHGLRVATGEGVGDYLLECLPGAVRVRVSRPTIGFIAEVTR